MHLNVWMLNLKQLLADQEMKVVLYSISNCPIAVLQDTVHHILIMLS